MAGVTAYRQDAAQGRMEASLKIKRVIAQAIRRGTRRPVPNCGTCEFQIVELAGC